MLLVLLSTTATERAKLQAVGITLCAGALVYLLCKLVRCCGAGEGGRWGVLCFSELPAAPLPLWSPRGRCTSKLHQTCYHPLAPPTSQAPYHASLLNHTWVGLWAALAYVAAVRVSAGGG